MSRHGKLAVSPRARYSLVLFGTSISDLYSDLLLLLYSFLYITILQFLPKFHLVSLTFILQLVFIETSGLYLSNKGDQLNAPASQRLGPSQPLQ